MEINVQKKKKKLKNVRFKVLLDRGKKKERNKRKSGLKEEKVEGKVGKS